jgi:hypothetical protein
MTSVVEVEMISRLETLTNEISALHSRLILLIGPRRSGKTRLLASFGERMGLVPLNIGSELGHRLMAIPHKQRQLQAGNLLRELADSHAPGDLLLIDNIELLFDPTQQLSPLDLLKKQAHTKKVVAVWPGELRGEGRMARLTYAEMGHPEQRDYATDGVVPFEIQQ